MEVKTSGRHELRLSQERKLPSEQEACKRGRHSWRGEEESRASEWFGREGRRAGRGKSESGGNCPEQGNREGCGSWRLGRKRDLLMGPDVDMDKGAHRSLTHQ